MEVTQLLQSALDPSNAPVQRAAEEQLRHAEQTNFAIYMVTLCSELHDESKPPSIRQFAGILMKNSVDAKDRQTKLNFSQRWVTALSDEAREQVKTALLLTLASPVKEANSTAAMVISKIAAIELPLRKWDQLVSDLLANVQNQASTVQLLEGTLDALGLICEEAVEDELDVEVLAVHSPQILSAVVTGMEYNSPEPEKAVIVRRSAVTALLNALEFVKENFMREPERNYIMETVCNCASYDDVEVRKTAFECLVKIAELYYNELEKYMNVIYELTVRAIKQDEEKVALQAIEFWSSIAEEELSLQEEVAMANSVPRSKHFVHKALEVLCPVICECLLQQDELQDDDTWNKATAAGTCLDLLAECAPLKIIDQVVPFVEVNIQDATNWRAREAGIMAFGSILEGPPLEKLNPLIERALPLMLNILRSDEVPAVRDTAAWTVGRVCRISKVQVSRYVEEVIKTLTHALKDEPRVAKNACWSIHNLAELFEDDVDSQVGSLSPYVEEIIAGLLDATYRSDADENNLRPSAYEALSMILLYLPQGSIRYIEHCIPLLLDRLEATLQNPGLTAEDRAAVIDAQGLLCGALQIATQRLKAQGILPHCDRMISCYLRLFEQEQSASVSEEVLMAVGSVADALEDKFIKYTDAIMPSLIRGLRSWEQYQVCSVAVGVIGDVCRAIEKKVLKYTDEIVQFLLQALGNNELDKSVKPPMLSCLGDIAMAIGGDFERYFSSVMTMLETAAKTSMRSEYRALPDDYDMIDWLLQLRSSIFEAYTGIVQGLKNDNKQELMRSHHQWMLEYCQAVNADEVILQANRVLGEKQLSQAAGVIGDMVTTTEVGAAKQLGQQPWVQNLLEKVCESSDVLIRSTGMWAKAALSQA